MHTETRACLSSLETVGQSLLQQNASLVENFKQSMSDKLDEGHAEAIRCLEQIEQSREALMQSFTCTLNELKQRIESTLESQQTAVREQFELAINHGRAHDAKCVEFCQTSTAQLTDLQATVASFERGHDRLEQYLEKSRIEQQRELAVVQQFEQNLMGQLKTFVQQITASKQQQTELTAIVADVSGELAAQSKRAPDQIGALHRTIEQKREAVHKSTTERDVQASEYGKLIAKHRTHLTEQLASVSAEQVALNDQRLVDTLEREHSRLSTDQQEARERLTDFHASFHTQNAHFRQTQQERIGRAVGGLEAQQSAQCQFGTAYRGHTQRIAQAIDTYQRTTNETRLVELQGDFERFHGQDLTFYQSTGKTPIRKKVQYPRDIAMTSPDERILRRFWREKGLTEVDLSTTICEDMEDMCPLERSATSRALEIRNSTPLTQRSNTMQMDDDRVHFKELQISNIATKMNSVQMLDDSAEDNKENNELVNGESEHHRIVENGIKCEQNAPPTPTIISP